MVNYYENDQKINKMPSTEMFIKTLFVSIYAVDVKTR